MRVAAVLPFVVPDYHHGCALTLRLPNVLHVDNSERGPYGRNLGVMRSHNMGIDYMREIGADWLVVISAAVRFGPPGGLDFLEALEVFPDAACVCAEDVFGWHLIAFPAETIEAAGRWDENFHPYGFDDNDYAIRVRKSRPGAEWVKVPVDVDDSLVGMGHSVKVGGVMDGLRATVNAEAQLRYFEAKWGNRPGVWFDEYHDTPFDNPWNDVGYWPSSPLTWGATYDARAPEEP